MATVSIESFSQLEAFLREWKSFGDRQIYDFNGMVALLAACLDNLHAHSLQSDLEEIGESLTDSQKSVLKRIAENV